jgi:hypothetical protein
MCLVHIGYFRKWVCLPKGIEFNEWEKARISPQDQTAVGSFEGLSFDFKPLLLDLLSAESAAPE